MTRAERRWCVLFAAGVVLLTAAPYLVGFARSDEAWIFSGFVLAVEDGHSYIAKMRLGGQGAWLFRTPYTAYPQRGVVAFLPYLLLGKVAGPDADHGALVALFHLARALAIPFWVLETYRFAALFLESPVWRRWVTFLATLGGGLGWLLLLVGRESLAGSLPLDVYSPETFGFLALFGLPHLALARATLLRGVRRLVDTEAGGAWTAGLWLFLTGLIQPLSLATGLAVVGVFVILRFLSPWPASREALAGAKRCLMAGFVPMPLVIYYLVQSRLDPFFAAWTEQNRILSPHPVHYLLAYGAVLPAAVGGSLIAWRTSKGRPHRLLPLAWAAAFPFLAYAPHNLQRRLPEGTWLALLVLAAMYLSTWEPSRVRWARWTLSGLLLPTTLLLVLGSVGVALRRQPPVFLPGDKVAAFRWLAEHAESGEVVLTDFASGNALPAWAPVRVVIGHGPESVGLEDLEPQVEAFLSGGLSTEEAWDLLARFQVRYVLAGPPAGERAVEAYGLKPAYSRGGYRIYPVEGES